MAKRITMICDRCQQELTPLNWWMDKELCNNCFLIVELATTTAGIAEINQETQEQLIQRLQGLYDPEMPATGENA